MRHKSSCKCLKVKHTTPTLYFDSFVESGGFDKVEKVMVNQVGPSVHVNLYEDTGKFFTTGTPAKFRFSLPVQSKIVQQSAGLVIFSTEFGTASGDVAIHVDTYKAGTVSQSGNTVTGINTNFLPSMIGGVIKFSNGKCVRITGYNSPTSLTVDKTRTFSAQAYSLEYSYAKVYLIGPPLQGSEYDHSQLTIDFTYIV
jgi:hypothetical protein